MGVEVGGAGKGAGAPRAVRTRGGHAVRGHTAYSQGWGSPPCEGARSAAGEDGARLFSLGLSIANRFATRG